LYLDNKKRLLYKICIAHELGPQIKFMSGKEKSGFKILAALIGLALGLVCGILLFLWIIFPLNKLSIASTPPTKLVILPTVQQTNVQAATPSLTMLVSNLPESSPTTTPAPSDLANNIQTAVSLMKQERFAEAIPYWDLVIYEIPSNGKAYANRGQCYLELTKNQRTLEEYLSYAELARADLDKAVELGGAIGNTYFNRHTLFADLVGVQKQRADRDYLNGIALENLRMSVHLGNDSPFSYRRIPLLLFNVGRCEEGMEEVKRIRQDVEGRSAPPSASLYNIEAHGYLCLGNLDKALDYVDRGLEIDNVPERRWLRSIILYQLGRKQEALDELNQLIEAKPYYNGYRYYLRALIYYDMGSKDLALQDLQSGSANTWSQSGLRSYVLGRIALDDGERQEGIQLLQDALATLEWYFRPTLFKQIEQELAANDAQPLPEVRISGIEATTMPTPPPSPTPAATEANLPGKDFPLPPSPTPVNPNNGTGLIRLNQFDYPVILFKPEQTISILSVQSMVLHLQTSDVDAGLPPFRVFLWSPETGEWSMVRPLWGENSIKQPMRYVDDQGNLYLAVYYVDEKPLSIENLWVTIHATTTDGSTIMIDLDEQ